MNIGGFLSLSLCDFPGKVAAVVFLNGCNFRCPWCHNGHLLRGEADPEDVRAQLADEQSAEQVGYRAARSTFLEKLGACEEVNIPGSHFIYTQKPDEVAKAIEDLLARIP